MLAARRAHLEAAVIVDLTDTTAGAIAAALVQARHSAGVPAVGMVMTLVIVTDEADHYDALRAALDAAREHPSRILVTIQRRGRAKERLDAEVRFLGDSGPGETVVMRLHGELADHARVGARPVAAPRRPCRRLVAGRGPGRAGEGPGRRAGPASGHRLGGRGRPARRAGAPVGRLPARGHRPGLDPDHPVAHPARGRPGPAVPGGHRRRRLVRAGVARARSCSPPGSRGGWACPSGRRTPRAPASPASGWTAPTEPIEVVPPRRPGGPAHAPGAARAAGVAAAQARPRRSSPRSCAGSTPTRCTARSSARSRTRWNPYRGCRASPTRHPGSPAWPARSERPRGRGPPRRRAARGGRRRAPGDPHSSRSRRPGAAPRWC